MVFGGMVILLMSFLGYFAVMINTLKNDYGIAFGKLAFPVGLITPIVVIMIFCSLDNSIYLTGPVSQTFACGHIVSDIITGLTLYLFIEYPVKTVISYVIGS